MITQDAFTTLNPLGICDKLQCLADGTLSRRKIIPLSDTDTLGNVTERQMITQDALRTPEPLGSCDK